MEDITESERNFEHRFIHIAHQAKASRQTDV